MSSTDLTVYPEPFQMYRADIYGFIFGRLIRELRRSRGMGQVEIADIMNVSQPTLARFESGSLPKVYWVREFSKAMGVVGAALYNAADEVEATLCIWLKVIASGEEKSERWKVFLAEQGTDELRTFSHVAVADWIVTSDLAKVLDFRA